MILKAVVAVSHADLLVLLAQDAYAFWGLLAWIHWSLVLVASPTSVFHGVD